MPNSLKTAGIAPPKRFTFDRVYDVAATQEQLFETSVAPVVDEVLAGYSCTVFAYGQTGTGKTFTMEGNKREDGSLDTGSANAGIIARAVSRVFRGLEAAGGDSHVKISFLEIYNEVRAVRAHTRVLQSGRSRSPVCVRVHVSPPSFPPSLSLSLSFSGCVCCSAWMICWPSSPPPS